MSSNHPWKVFSDNLSQLSCIQFGSKTKSIKTKPFNSCLGFKCELFCSNETLLVLKLESFEKIERHVILDTSVVQQKFKIDFVMIPSPFVVNQKQLHLLIISSIDETEENRGKHGKHYVLHLNEFPIVKIDLLNDQDLLKPATKLTDCLSYLSHHVDISSKILSNLPNLCLENFDSINAHLKESTTKCLIFNPKNNQIITSDFDSLNQKMIINFFHFDKNEIKFKSTDSIEKVEKPFDYLYYWNFFIFQKYDHLWIYDFQKGVARLIDLADSVDSEFSIDYCGLIFLEPEMNFIGLVNINPRLSRFEFHLLNLETGIVSFIDSFNELFVDYCYFEGNLFYFAKNDTTRLKTIKIF